MIDIGIY